MMNSTQCSDNLCQAIEIIANKVIQGLNYDKTILCTITDNKNANRGEYTVSDGVSSYSVYGSNQTYKVDTQVYVLIPNGDYEAQKLIISEYSPADDIEKGYAPPGDTIIPVETIYNTSNEIGLKANVNGEGNIGSAIKIKNSLKMNLSPKYTRLLLDCEFRTAFKEEIQSGNYSIVIIINGLDKDGFKIKGKKYIFDCSSFFGNPYNFEGGGVQQSIVFDTSIFSKINTISIQFQESGNFYNKDGDYLPVAEENNIFLSKFSMIIGFDIDEYKNNDLLITTTDDLSYENEKVKNLQLNWIRNRNNNTLFSINGTSDISLNNYNYLRHLWRTKGDTEEEKICYIGKSSNYLSFYWYRYTLDDDLPTDILLQENYWKVEQYYNNKFYSLPSDVQKQHFEFSFNPKVIGRAREKIKVAVAISGCLRKKVLKLQEITLPSGETINATVLEEKEKPYYMTNKEWEKKSPKDKYRLSYNYTYYSPLEEINVEEIFSESDHKKQELGQPYDYYRSFYYDSKNGKYIELQLEIEDEGKIPPKSEDGLSKNYYTLVEWVQYYKQSKVSLNDDNTPVKENGNIVYIEDANPLYLTDKEYNELKNETFNYEEEGKTKNIYAYNFINYPITTLKSKEIIFENKDKGVYKKLNLIKDIKLEATDELQGNYLIYDFSNMISETMANSINRNIKATFSSINSKDVITGNVVFQWKFPKSNTMLNEPQPVKLDNTVYKVINSSDGKLHWKDNKDGFYISSEVEILNSQSGNADETVELSVEIPYTIKRYYSPKQHNNKIIFLVYKKVNGSDDKDLAENKEKNKREINLSFGSSGTNGTNYTFVLNLGCKYKNKEGKDDVNNLKKVTDEFQSFLNSNEEDSWIKIEANLFENNNKIAINEKQIKWSWHIAPYFYEDRVLSDKKNKITLRYKNIKWEKNSQNQLYIRTCRINNCISDSDGEDADGHKIYSISDKVKDSKDSKGKNLEDSEYFKGRYHCAILKANISYNNKILEAYLPIGMRFDEKAISFDIADKIVYNSNGTNPQYYMSYQRTYDENNNIIPLEYNIYVDHFLVPEKVKYLFPYFDHTISSCIYEGKSFILYDLTPTPEKIFYGYCSDLFKKDEQGIVRGEIYRFNKDTLEYTSKDNIEIVSQSNSKIKFYLLKENSDEHLNNTLYTGQSPCNASKINSVLKASPIFYTNLSSQRVSILASDSVYGTYYVQPILIIQNRFGNSMLNEWDGKLVVDDKNNYILSAQVGAGIKNNDNSFTGVLMGDVTRSDLGSGISKIGLYGYSKGALTFGFDIDGKAFLGASGNGRILIDGSGGSITSQHYEKNQYGLKIDLNDGKLDSKNRGGQITIDPTEDGSSLFKVSGYDKNGKLKTLINIDSEFYYLQSIDYSLSGNKGTLFNLGSGDFVLKSIAGQKLNDGKIIFSSVSPYFQIGIISNMYGEKITIGGINYYFDLYAFYNDTNPRFCGRNIENDKWYLIFLTKKGYADSSTFLKETEEEYDYQIISSDKKSFVKWTGGTSKGKYCYISNLEKFKESIFSLSEITLSNKQDFLNKAGDSENYMYYNSGSSIYYFKKGNSYIREFKPIRTDSYKTLIDISSNSYYLQSVNYNNTNGIGLKINLNTGRIISRNIGGIIDINPSSSSSLFNIKDSDNQTLINIGSNSYYLQSANYNSTDGIGLKINLNTGRILSRNTGGIIDINPSSSSSLFNIKDSDNQTLINIGSSYYLQSADYISGIKGFRLNLQTHSFSFQQFLPKKDLTNAGITLSNSSSGYFKIVKNRKRLAKNISFIAPGETEEKKYNIYADPWGINIYIRDCSTGEFYSVKSKKEECKLDIGIERTGDTFSMTPYDGTTPWKTGYKFRILGNIGLTKLIDNMTSKTLLDFSDENYKNWSYNSNLDRLECKNSVANDKKKYTNLYYPLEYATATIRSDQFSRSLLKTGHTNSLAYSASLNKFFSTRDEDLYIVSYICDFTNGNTSSFEECYELEVSAYDTSSAFWQIAIPKNNDKILYGLTSYLYEYEYSSAEDKYLLKKNIAPLSNFKKNKDYEYQGMAADNKYIYLPRFKKNTGYKIQDIQVVNISDGYQKSIIELNSIDTDYEIEEIDFLDDYLYASFSRVGGYATGYISKIYKFKYSNTNIPTSLDLIDDVIDSWIVINNINTTHKSGQGFCVGKVAYLNSKNEKVINNCFINGFYNSSIGAGSDGLALINIMGTSNLQEEEAINLFYVSRGDYYLQSQNYRYSGSVSSIGNTGFKLDLQTGHLYACNFNMQLGKENGSYIKIDSAAGTYPIQVYGPTDANGDRKRCVISWNGILTAEGANIDGKITATTLTLSDSAKNSVTNDVVTVSSTSDGKLIVKDFGTGTLSLTDPTTGSGYFKVSSKGLMIAENAIIKGTIYASSGYIGNWDISNNHILKAPTISSGKVTRAGTGMAATSGKNNAAFWAGYEGKTESPYTYEDSTKKTTWKDVTSFYVLNDGTVKATKATIEGTISSSTISSSIITGSTIQTATSETDSSRIVIDSSGNISCYYYNILYGRITTTNTSTDKYWTFLGHLDSNWNSVAYKGITLGFDLGTWGEENTARYTLKATSHDFMGPVYMEEMWLNCKETNALVLYYDNNNNTITFSGGSKPLKLHTKNEFQLSSSSYPNIMTINREFKDDQIHFHQPTHFESTVYNKDGVQVFISDRNTKNSILPLAENHEIFFKNLKPVIFKYNNGTSNRFHTGFIAQDVLAAIENCGLTTQDIGAYIKHEVILENESYIEQALRYDEFIALNTHMIQKCLKRIDDLEIELNTLKDQL